MRPGRYRKKPVEIDAFQIDGTEEKAHEARLWIESESGHAHVETRSLAPGTSYVVIVHTLEGKMRADAGDWIIRGVQGEFYPCKPDIFAATYERAEDFVGEPDRNEDE